MQNSFSAASIGLRHIHMLTMKSFTLLLIFCFYQVFIRLMPSLEIKKKKLNL